MQLTINFDEDTFKILTAQTHTHTHTHTYICKYIYIYVSTPWG